MILVGNRFHSQLERLKGSIYIPKGKEHPFIACWKKGLEYLKIKDDFDWTNLPKTLRVRDAPGIGTATDIITLCNHFKVNCDVYVLGSKPEYDYFDIEKRYPERLYKQTIYLHTQGLHWCLFRKAKRGRVKALDRVQCRTCRLWVYCEKKRHFLKDHYRNCILCVCGDAYQKGSTHPNTCNKRKKRSWTTKDKFAPATACKMYKPDTQPHYLNHNHHADFETIPAGVGKTMVVDSAGLWDDTNKQYKSWYGKEALKDWFEYIVENLEGNLWFFYGSKFDTHMIFKYMIENGITLNKEKTMIRGNMIYILGLVTKKGTVIIKDLTKFLVGSLDYNCKAFGVGQEHAKTSFEHEKCQTWEDVELYKVCKKSEPLLGIEPRLRGC